MTPPLTQAESLRLILRIRAGDDAALSEMARAHLPLVQACLKRFSGRGRDMEELYQQGCLGLVKALKRFDPAFEVCFSTYAVPVILGEIRRFLRDDHPVHLVRQDKERLAQIPKASAALAQALGREPTITELAASLRVDPNELVLLMESRVSPLSMDQGEPGQRALWERLGDPNASQWLDRLMLKDLIQRLPEQARQLLYLRYRVGHTQAQAAQVLGISQVQVSRLEKRIRTTLKQQWDAG
ncbi:MAG: sigma-70 family RNA polymerase sigma factor [Clostridia bacterium]|nr:sigma-70 family RNA polymerase sigma factor [Clostridia bacterium]